MIAPGVTLRPVDRDNVDEVLELAAAPRQASLVASAAVTLAQAQFEPGAWVRAVYAASRPVGLLAMFDPRRPGAEEDPLLEAGDILLWRLLIDRHAQGRGHGRQAVLQAVEQFALQPDLTRMIASYPATPAAPAGFFERLGFIPTGRMDDGEIVVARPLRP